MILALTGPREYGPGDWDRLRDVVLAELAGEPEQPLYLPEPADPRLRAATGLLHADPATSPTLAALGHAIGRASAP